MNPAILQPGADSGQVIGQRIQHRGLGKGRDHGQRQQDDQQSRGDQTVAARGGEKLPDLPDRAAQEFPVGREVRTPHHQQRTQQPAVENEETRGAKAAGQAEDHPRARGQREQRPEPRDARLKETVFRVSAGAHQQPRGGQGHPYVG